MRKRLLLLMAVTAGVFFICSSAFAQSGTYTPGLGEGVCCNHGVPQIPEGQKCLLLHQLGPGENLHILAAYYYGDARAWRRIYNLNKKAIRNPNKVMAGQILKIEVPACWTPRFDLQEFMRLEERRIQMLKRGPGEKVMEYRSKVTVEPKVKVIIEEEEEVPGEPGRTPVMPGERTPEAPPAEEAPTIEIEEGGAEE